MKKRGFLLGGCGLALVLGVACSDESDPIGNEGEAGSGAAAGFGDEGGSPIGGRVGADEGGAFSDGGKPETAGGGSDAEPNGNAGAIAAMGGSSGGSAGETAETGGVGGDVTAAAGQGGGTAGTETVECGGLSCDQACCYLPGGTPSHSCRTSQNFCGFQGWTALFCDSAADCNVGEVCCQFVTKTAMVDNAACFASCPPEGVKIQGSARQLCAGDGECPGSQHCRLGTDWAYKYCQ